MPRQQLPAQLIDSPLCGLDQKQLLSLFFDLSLPPIDGGEPGEDVDARGQPQLNQLSGETGSVEGRVDGGEYEDRLLRLQDPPRQAYRRVGRDEGKIVRSDRRIFAF